MSRAGVWCLQVRCRQWGGLGPRQHLWGSPGPSEKAQSTSGTPVLLGPLPAGLVGEALPRHRRQPAVPSVFVQVELGGGFGPQSASQNPLRRAGLLTPTRSPICTSHSTLGGGWSEALGGSGGDPPNPPGEQSVAHMPGDAFLLGSCQRRLQLRSWPKHAIPGHTVLYSCAILK